MELPSRGLMLLAGALAAAFLIFLLLVTRLPLPAVSGLVALVSLAGAAGVVALERRARSLPDVELAAGDMHPLPEAAEPEENLESLVETAFCLKEEGSFLEALRTLQKAVEKTPSTRLRSLLRLERATLFLALNNLPRARRECQKALKDLSAEGDGDLREEIEAFYQHLV